MATIPSNHCLFHLASGDIDFDADSFKIILMDTGFVFDVDNHSDYADVSASELATGNGYTQNTKALAGVAVTQDDSDNRCEITWNDVVWTASGGSIGPVAGAIIIDDTVTNDVVIGYIDFSTERTQADGGAFTIANPEVRIQPVTS
jgi:hypothetical protein